MDCAVIFDVDGVLLELTRSEEEVFFEALSAFVPTDQLSRDWNSYASRNDEDIIDEILEKAGKPVSLKQEAIPAYLALLERQVSERTIVTEIIPGSNRLLEELAAAGIGLGIATANLLGAARIRLEHAGLWNHVAAFPFGADGGGHKRQTVARAISATGLPKNRIVYVGDNLNDVDAGLSNGVHFIGFSLDPVRCERLAAAGACHTAADHGETARLIGQFLSN